MSTADIFERAAKLIEPEGAWRQQGFVSNRSDTLGSDGDPWPRGKLRYCMMGAISRANGDKYVAETALYSFAEQLGFPSTINAYRWNDAPERTQAEVIAKLRKAAAKAKPVSA